MIRHIFKKDWTLLWPLVVLVAALQVAYEWVAYKLEILTGSPVASQLLRPVLISWHVGLVSIAVLTVQEDAIPGVDLDWLVRPLQRTELLVAKLLFVGLTVCIPMFLLNTLHGLAWHFPLLPTMGLALYKAAYVFVCLLVPAMAVASIARNLSELLVLLALVFLVYAGSLWLSGLFLGADRCPTCETSVSWVQHALQHVEVLVGSALILALQYYGRRTEISRRIAVLGVVVLACLQLPWGVAFELQTRLDGEPSSATGINVALGAATAPPSSAGGAADGKNLTRQTTQDLLKGNVGGAVRDLSGQRENAPVKLRLPVQVSGLSPGQFLRADRAEYSLLDGQGQLIYRGRNVWPAATSLVPDPPGAGVALQTLEIPRNVYARLLGKSLRVSIDYSLTLMAPIARRQLAARDGEVAAADIGVCQSLTGDAGISIRCKKTAIPPVCFSATLYAPDGAHNASILRCSEDYRPYIPALTDIIAVSGIDMATRDPYGYVHYNVDPSLVPQSYVVLNIYNVSGHLRRTAVTPLFNLED